MSPRTNIRTALAAAIRTIPALATTTHIARRVPLKTLPAACLYIETENKTLHAMSIPRRYRRELKITIELYTTAANPEALETALDNLEADLEAAIANNETLNGLLHQSSPVSTEYTTDETSATPLGTALCTYSAVYIS
jgi:hypothetical protein